MYIIKAFLQTTEPDNNAVKLVDTTAAHVHAALLPLQQGAHALDTAAVTLIDVACADFDTWSHAWSLILQRFIMVVPGSSAVPFVAEDILQAVQMPLPLGKVKQELTDEADKGTPGTTDAAATSSSSVTPFGMNAPRL